MGKCCENPNETDRFGHSAQNDSQRTWYHRPDQLRFDYGKRFSRFEFEKFTFGYSQMDNLHATPSPLLPYNDKKSEKSILTWSWTEKHGKEKKRTRDRAMATERETSLVCSEMGEFVARIRINFKLLNRKNDISFVKCHARKFAYWVGTSTRQLVNSAFAINMKNNARYICWTMCSFFSLTRAHYSFYWFQMMCTAQCTVHSTCWCNGWCQWVLCGHRYIDFEFVFVQMHSTIINILPFICKCQWFRNLHHSILSFKNTYLWNNGDCPPSSAAVRIQWDFFSDVHFQLLKLNYWNVRLNERASHNLRILFRFECHFELAICRVDDGAFICALHNHFNVFQCLLHSSATFEQCDAWANMLK